MTIELYMDINVKKVYLQVITAKIVNGDITSAAHCHCQRASKVMSPFISFAVFDVSLRRYILQIK